MADLFVVFARTQPPTDTGTGIAVFLVPADTPGITVGPKDVKMGQDGRRTAEVSFDDVRVGRRRPDRRGRRGRLPRGDDVAGPRTPAHRRSVRSASAQRALDESVAYAATATQGGTPIGDFQLVQAMLADQQTGVLAGRAHGPRSRRLYVTGQDRRIAPSAAKLFCTEMVGQDRRPRSADPRRNRLHAGSSRSNASTATCG